VQGEDALSGGWAHERAERHRAFLAAKGYEPTAFEVEQAQEAARRHEESLARTAEFRAQAAPPEEAVTGMDDQGAGEDPPQPDAGDEEAAFDDAG